MISFPCLINCESDSTVVKGQQYGAMLSSFKGQNLNQSPEPQTLVTNEELKKISNTNTNKNKPKGAKQTNPYPTAPPPPKKKLPAGREKEEREVIQPYRVRACEKTVYKANDVGINGNLVPRVLGVFGQRVSSRRDSGMQQAFRSELTIRVNS